MITGRETRFCVKQGEWLYAEQTCYNIKEQRDKFVRYGLENGYDTVEEAIDLAGYIFEQEKTENVAVVGYEIEYAEDGHWTCRGHIGYIKTIYKA